MKKFDIVVEDDRLFLREYRYTKSISLEKFARSVLDKQFTLETKQLPPNCVKYIRKKSIETYYIHIPEDFYNLKEDNKSYTVRLPHTIFIFTFEMDKTTLAQDIRVSWTADEILDLSQPHFFSPFLQNVYTRRSETSAGICTPRPQEEKSQHRYIERFLEMFFETNFNHDLPAHFKTIPSVSREQRSLLKSGMKPHEVTQVWWKGIRDDGSFYDYDEQYMVGLL